MDVGIIKDYFNEDELKIGIGTWAGMYSTDLIAKFLYKTLVKGETSKLKSLIIDLATKGVVGMLYFYLGKKNAFFRYMAIGSMVSMINSVTNYFLPTPTSIAEKVQNYAQNSGLVVQAF